MSTQLEQKIYRAAALTFEELGLMLPMEEEAVDRRQPYVAVCVDFTGPFCGSMVIKACDELLGALAANMLGVSETPSQDEQRDALGEVANVMCGNLLPAIAENEIFHLEAPRLLENVDDPPSCNEDPVADVHIILDEGSADVLLFVENEIPALKE
jgi:CheY-specific phosphatase CheX